MKPDNVVHCVAYKLTSDIRHIYKKANAVADNLSETRIEQSRTFMIHDTPTREAAADLGTEVSGFPVPQLLW